MKHTRRPYTLVLFGILACIALAVQVPVQAQTRNLVLMISDDHGADAGYLGHPVVRTPHLDRLAARSVNFTRAYCATASCAASRAVVYTGLYTHANGQYGHLGGYNNQSVRPHVQTLPWLLRQAGVATGIVGKNGIMYPEGQGFEYAPWVGPRDPQYAVRLETGVREFLERHRTRPFVLVVGFNDTHRSLRSPGGFANFPDYDRLKPVRYDPADAVVPGYLQDTPVVREELANYYQAVSRLDQTIGMVLRAIEEYGVADHTMIMYTSDHGIPFAGAKTTAYDPGLHVPLLVATPDLSQRGMTSNAMASLVDITPTVLDWMDVPGPAEYDLQGRSLLPILGDGNPAGWDVMFASHIFHEITMYYPMRVIQEGNLKLILNLAHQLPFPTASDLFQAPTWQEVLSRGLRRMGHRTVEAYVHRPREEFYDLDADPWETRNLVGDPRYLDRLNDLRARLKAWQEATGDPWAVKYQYE